MQATIRWQGKVSFKAESGSGHAVVLDGPAEKGGENLGPRPMELLLMGLGACTSFDVVTILQKQRREVSDCVAEVEAERADTVPAVFTRIHIRFIVTGKQLPVAAVERAVALSAEKYCSASLMLERGGVAITHSVDVRES